MSAIELKRNISLTLVFFYGLGTIVGAGIYVLIGKVAGVAGIYTPFAFLLSAFVAAFTAYSYAKLAQRYPKSGGEATYVFEAFHRHRFSAIVGWLVVFTGMISAATLTRGFVGYMHVFMPISDWMIIFCIIVLMCLVACWSWSMSTGSAWGSESTPAEDRAQGVPGDFRVLLQSSDGVGIPLFPERNVDPQRVAGLQQGPA